MKYTLVAETGKIGVRVQAMNAEERRVACEAEIVKVLEKYSCTLLVGVMPQEETKT
jgi:hypothetical protein